MSTSYELNFGNKYNESLPTLGEVMGDVIQFFGGEKVYGVGGDFAANLIAALDTKLNVLPSSNEMHAGFSACAQAEVSGMGFCLTTYMVGSLPCVTAAGLAVTESLPVVFISGAPAESEISNQAIHHTIHPNASWKTQYDNALNAYTALGIKVERLQGDRASSQPNIAGNRFYHLVAHAYKTKQPVFIEVPRDLVFAKTQLLKLPATINDIRWGENVLCGSQLIVESIVSKLRNAKAPMLYLGDKLKHNQVLKKLIIDFAEKFSIPFATSWFAKGIFDEYHPLSLGAYNGIFTQTQGREYIETKVDYVLDVATSIFAQDTNTAFATGTHKIENFTNKTLLKGGSVLERDIIEVFELLIDLDISPFSFQPLNNTQSSVNAAKINTYKNVHEAIDFNNLAQVLNELQQEDQTPYVYLPEVGNSYFCSYGLRVRKSNIGRGWLTNPWYGAMGTALPYARTVTQQIKEQGNKDRAVVIIGDGGFHFQSNELIHFLKDQTDVTIIYMRNNVFHLGKSGDGLIYHCNHSDFDVHNLVKAYQGMSYVCQSILDFKKSFKEALNHKGIQLIEILAKPTEDRQCNELKLLNLYIKANNGNSEAKREWALLTTYHKDNE
ncbi:thiamine pyrophosphate-dependent enzyme [Thalassotalea piscium]|uniref:TPP-dependent 2-oxoacid decarboxylase n=1 Tax=Thalassotalea piscium TaxID=1230533 RepID=A0A7X0NGY7_9GAMM|nr:thiamine pyrophosphate-dependent enzyme [Thalassotalea piscium]MBB6543279.1 TPP-dependent 2-oxoacid decarboxylase [Thalassotalea piscium]